MLFSVSKFRSHLEAHSKERGRGASYPGAEAGEWLGLRPMAPLGLQKGATMEMGRGVGRCPRAAAWGQDRQIRCPMSR